MKGPASDFEILRVTTGMSIEDAAKITCRSVATCRSYAIGRLAAPKDAIATMANVYIKMFGNGSPDGLPESCERLLDLHRRAVMVVSGDEVTSSVNPDSGCEDRSSHNMSSQADTAFVKENACQDLLRDQHQATTSENLDSAPVPIDGARLAAYLDTYAAQCPPGVDLPVWMSKIPGISGRRAWHGYEARTVRVTIDNRDGLVVEFHAILTHAKSKRRRSERTEWYRIDQPSEQMRIGRHHVWYPAEDFAASSSSK